MKWYKNVFSIFTIGIAFLVFSFLAFVLFAIIWNGGPGFFANLQSKEVLFALKLSLCTSTISTCIVFVLSIFTAYAFCRTNMPLKKTASVLMELTLSVPYILLGLALLIVFASPFGKWLKELGIPVIFSPLGIIMAHLIVNLPYMIRLMVTAFEELDFRYEFIAQTLGASPFQSFLTILLPMCRNNLMSAFLLTWSRAMGEFGATLMVVGITRMKTETLPGNIYLAVSTGNTEAAMSTALLILIISAFVLILSLLLTRKNSKKRRKASFL